MKKLQGMARTVINMQKTFVRIQIKYNLAEGGSKLELTLTDVYEK